MFTNIQTKHNLLANRSLITDRYFELYNMKGAINIVKLVLLTIVIVVTLMWCFFRYGFSEII